MLILPANRTHTRRFLDYRSGDRSRTLLAAVFRANSSGWCGIPCSGVGDGGRQWLLAGGKRRVVAEFGCYRHGCRPAFWRLGRICCRCSCRDDITLVCCFGKQRIGYRNRHDADVLDLCRCTFISWGVDHSRGNSSTWRASTVGCRTDHRAAHGSVRIIAFHVQTSHRTSSSLVRFCRHSRSASR